MARIAHELLADLDKETVDFALNYDESEREPVVLPAKIPNLLVNGSSGIAVGLATNIPPHNLREVIDGCLMLIDNPDASIDDLMSVIPGPDFPTAAMINGVRGIHEAYRTGRGRIYIRARARIEEMDQSGRQRIVVNELPYQVNKAHLLEKIAQLVREKRVEGISELRDESDKDGMRMVIELRRGEVGEVVLNNLYQHTQLQNVFGINLVALLDGQPRLLNLKQALEAFIRHRREVVTRRTIYDLRKARERAHILEGLTVALANIDEIIALIKAAAGPAEAKEQLMARDWSPGPIEALLGRADDAQPEGLAAGLGLSDKGYRLSPAQAQAILDLRLHRLTGLEQNKIQKEYGEILELIGDLLEILGSPDRLMAVIREELLAVQTQYGDERRTEILQDHLDLTLEDLINEEDVVVTLSHSGYAKSQPVTAYQAQHRGGRGKSSTTMKEDDFIDKLFVASTHDTLLCFSSEGKVYWMKVYEVPQASRNARGRPIVNLLPLSEEERITALLPIREYDDQHYVIMATEAGVIKKTLLTDFSRSRSNGIIAVDLNPGDHLVGVDITDGSKDIMLMSSSGKAIRFSETDVRPMGRVARGVRGIRLAKGQKVISLLILDQEGDVLTMTENGYGKRTAIAEYTRHGRGGQGIMSIQTSERNGQVVGAALVRDDDEIILISDAGTLVRTRVEEISRLGRNTQGVRIIRLSEQERLVDVVRAAQIEGMSDDELPEDSDIESEDETE